MVDTEIHSKEEMICAVPTQQHPPAVCSAVSDVGYVPSTEQKGHWLPFLQVPPPFLPLRRYLQTLSKVSQLGSRACLEPYPKRTGCAHKNIYSSQVKQHMGRSWIQLGVYPVKSRCLKQDQIPAQVKSVLRMKTIVW